MKYNIFGLNVEFNFCASIDSGILNQALSLYKDEWEGKTVDIIINIIDSEIMIDGMNNPKSHETDSGGLFVIRDNNWYEVSYQYSGEVVDVNVGIKNKSFFREQLRKIRTYDFHYFKEDLPQVIHEMVLIPALYLSSHKRAIIHASGVQLGERTILLGGTGGVGKTSLEMLLCRGSSKAAFITDDIAVVNEDGCVYPNYAYPKIYSYNVQNNKKIREEILNGRSILNKISWYVLSYFRGGDKVRRKISPAIFYENVAIGQYKVTDYYFLIRDSNADDVTLEQLDYRSAARMTRLVIENEYLDFHRHLIWHEMNLLAVPGNESQLIKCAEKLDGWEMLYQNIFKNVNCKLVRIPKVIPHERMVNSILNKIIL